MAIVTRNRGAHDSPANEKGSVFYSPLRILRSTLKGKVNCREKCRNVRSTSTGKALPWGERIPACAHKLKGVDTKKEPNKKERVLQEGKSVVVENALLIRLGANRSPNGSRKGGEVSTEKKKRDKSVPSASQSKSCVVLHAFFNRGEARPS